MKHHNQFGGDYDLDKIVLETAILTRINDLETFLNYNLFSGNNITPLIITHIWKVINFLTPPNYTNVPQIGQLYHKYMFDTTTEQTFRKSIEVFNTKIFSGELTSVFYIDGTNIYNILRELNNCILKNPLCFEEHIIQIREFCRNKLLPHLNLQQYMNTFILTYAPEQLRDILIEYINPIIIPVVESIQQIEHDVNERINDFESIVRLYIKRGYPDGYTVHSRSVIGGRRHKTRKYRK
jgi:hypothetical protein